MIDDTFAVLAVCHANLCRSPLVERLTRRAFADRLGTGVASFEVTSVGTDARPGAPMHPHAAQVLREWGADDADFRTRALVADAVARADLVLTATRLQRTRCVSMAPEAVRRTYTLRQFGRLAAAVDPASLPDSTPAIRARALVAEVNLARGDHQPVSVDDDDLADPVGHPVEAFRECARQIHAQLIDVMLDLLAAR